MVVRVCKLLLLMVITCAFSQSARSQVLTNDRSDEQMFLVEVKQIDEFLERFNDEHFSFIRREYRQQGTDKNINRTVMLARLFNMSRNDWNVDTLKSFLYQVIDPQNPVVLSFTDSNWYAEARCVFSYGKGTVLIPIIFHVRTTNPRGARWMIAGIGNPTFLSKMGMDSCSGTRSPKYHFIPTSSHVNRFLSLYRAFGDNANLDDYFDPDLLNRINTQKFIHALCNRSLALTEVKDIKFHFFQVANWLFTVERFERRSTNKGWLINRLSGLSDEEKQLKLRQLLYL